MIKRVFAALASSVFLAGILPSAVFVTTVTTATAVVQVITADLAQADQTTCYKGSFSTTCSGSSGTTTCYTGSFSTTCSGSSGTTTCYTGSFSTTCSGSSGTTTCYNGSFSTTCSGSSGTTTCYNGSFSTTCSGTNGTTTCYNGSFSTTCSGSGGILPLGSKTGGSTSGTLGGSTSGTLGGSTSGTLGGSTSGTLGGSTSGTLGGSTSGIAIPSCSKAPEIPNLSFTNLSDGIQFTASAKSLGEKATNLYYSYVYFDGAKNAWDAWSSWVTSAPSSVVSFKAVSGNNKTRIGFSVYASNTCGQSAQARESSAQTGLVLPGTSAISTTGASDAAAEFADANAAATDAINAAKSAISQFSKERSKCVSSYLKMDIDTLTKFSSYCLKLDNEYATLYRNIYAFNNTKFVTIDQANNGTDTANAYAEEADSLVAKMQDITETLVAAALTASESKKTSITCIKGSVTKKITAVKPVCPAGYKKK